LKKEKLHDDGAMNIVHRHQTDGQVNLFSEIKLIGKLFLFLKINSCQSIIANSSTSKVKSEPAIFSRCKIIKINQL
jgi:hypothetical protein